MTAKKSGGDGPPPDKPERKKPGPVTKFKPEFVGHVRKMCAAGLTDAEIADVFGVSRTTISTWKVQYPEFLAELRAGKEEADDRVERSLFQRACGYEYDAVKIFMPAGASEPIYAEYREHVPADPMSAWRWLNNRRPGTWRDKQIHEHTGLDGKPIESITTTMTAKEAADRYRDELG